MKRSKAEHLRQFYSCFKGGDNVLIAINADPDAIASAMAVKRLLWRKVANVTIASTNIVERPDNIAMMNLLGIPVQHLNTISSLPNGPLVIVDSQPSHFPDFPMLAKPAVVIDHHPCTVNCDTLDFKDIRPKFGATASIITEYLRAARIKPSTKLATGLYYAIKTDTGNFTRKTTIDDVRAFQFLFKHASMSLASKVERSDLEPTFLKYFKKAIETKRKRKNKMFVYLGRVETSDICVLIADFFMRLNNINWSIVAGVYDQKLIIIFRNDGVRTHGGNIAKQAFGDLGSAGGHKSMARAEIVTEQLRNKLVLGNHEAVLNWIIRKIEKRAGKS